MSTRLKGLLASHAVQAKALPRQVPQSPALQSPTLYSPQKRRVAHRTFSLTAYGFDNLEVSLAAIRSRSILPSAENSDIEADEEP